jgi:AsmA protein
MKRLLKWILVTLATLVVVVVMLAIALPVLFDPNDYRENIEAAVTDSTGLEFSIDGEIGWSVFPWVGMQAGPLVLGNAQGYQEAYLARIQSVDVRVRLVPLLRGQIQVGTVSLEGADIRAEVDAQGRGNWATLIEAGAGGKESGDFSTDQAADLSIAGLEITESSLSFSDPTGVVFAATGLTLSSGAIVHGQAVTAELEMNLEAGALPAPAELTGTLLVNPDPLSVTLESLVINLPLAEGDPLKLALAKPLSWQPGTRSMDLDASLTAGEMALLVAGRVSDLGNQPVVDARVSLAAFDPRPIIAGWSGKPLVLGDSSALSSLSLEAQLQWSGDRASLSDLSLKFDDTTVQVDVVLESLTALRGTVNGNIDTLNLDRYLPPSEDSAAAPAASATGEPMVLKVPGDLTGTLRVGMLKVAGLTAENTQVEILVKNGGFRLFPMTADLYGGTMRGALSLKPAGQEYRVVFKNSLKDIDAGPMLGDLAGEPVLGGRGTLAFEFKIKDPLADKPLRTADGGLEIRFRDGTIYGVNVMGMIRQAASVLKLGGNRFDTDKPQTDFTSMVVSADINQGVLTTKRFEMQAPFFRLAGAGSIDLADSSLDYTLTPVLIDSPEGQGGATLKNLEGLEIPVKLTGSLLNPDWEIDAARLLLASQRHKLDGSAGDLLDALTGDSGDGDQADKGDALLNALLNEAAKRSEEKKSREKDGKD